MKKLPRVIMAEFSDVRYDARVLKEAHSLSENGFHVHLHMYNTSIDKKKIRQDSNIKFYEYPFKNRRSDATKWGKAKKYAEALFFLLRVNLWIVMHKAEVYHAHNMKFLLPSFLSAILHRAKFVYDAHELHSEHYENTSAKNRLKNRLNMLTEKLVLKRCHAFIQASDERADFIATKYNIPKPHVINNYVPLKHVPATTDNFIKSKLNLDHDSPLLFYSGGIYMDRFYGFENTLKSMKAFPSLNFIIVGFMNNEIRLKFDDIIRSLNLSERVFILPPVPNKELMNYASAADIGIIPLMGSSVNTRLSALNKVSEYLMAGLPLLSTNYDNLNTIIYNNSHGQVGETFDIKSVASIEGAMRKLLDQKKYEKLKPNALKLAHNRLNWENEEKKILDIYRTF